MKKFYLIFMKDMKFFFHEIDLFDFMSFLPGLFKIFWPAVDSKNKKFRYIYLAGTPYYVRVMGE